MQKKLFGGTIAMTHGLRPENSNIWTRIKISKFMQRTLQRNF